MSLNIRVVAEDHTLDQYILLPVVRAIFEAIGRPRAKIKVHEWPRGQPRGVENALSPGTIAGIIEDSPWIDLVILVVDSDCVPHREDALRARAAEHGKVICCLAIQELEVWMLALHHRDLPCTFTEVRAHCHPKDEYAVPFLRRRGWASTLGRGRREAMRVVDAGFSGMLLRCPEVARLMDELLVHDVMKA